MGKVLKIEQIGSPILREKCDEVEEITDEIEELAYNMMVTMLTGHGVGLAANQVGQKKQVITIASDKFVGAMINPFICAISENTIKNVDEICLSIPGKKAKVSDRHAKIKVRYLDLKGEEKEELFSGYTSVIIQHEIDHLRGKLFTDYLEKKK